MHFFNSLNNIIHKIKYKTDFNATDLFSHLT